ncbi:MAG: hypothetical protein IT176_13875 [Acidobacteria bacterium]|nr:hypothetical protein [Acidobacteriota bacterium]
MGHWSRRALLLTLYAIAAGALFIACDNGNGTSGAVGTGGQADSPIAIASSARGLAITNNGRTSLTDLQIAIKPTGSAPTFQRAIPALAAGERREIALTDFKSSTNVMLNPMFITPKEVTLTAKDETGKDVSLTVPWK